MSWIIYALLSAVFAALVAILGKIGIKNIDTTQATTIRAVIMAVFLVCTSLALGKFSLQGISSKPLFFIVASGIAGALSWLFYFLALRFGPTTGVAAVDRLSVVFVVVFALLFLGEKLTWQTGIGAIFISAGAILMALQ